MFLKNLQMTRQTLTLSLLFLSQAYYVLESRSLDLKVDLPPEAGMKPVLYYNPIVNHVPDTNSFKSSQKKEELDSKNQKKNAQKILKQEQEIIEDISYANKLGDIPPPPQSLSNSKNKVGANKQIQNVETQNSKSNLSKTRQMRDDNSILEQPNLLTSSPSMDYGKDPFPMLPCIENNVKFWGRVYTEIDLNEAFLHDKNNLAKVYASVTLPQNKTQRSEFMDKERKKYAKILDNISNKLKVPQNKWTKEERRIAKLFKKTELTYHNLQDAITNLRFQTGLKSQFDAGVQRSINYLPSVYPIVKQSGLPIELALLPHVESSYNSKAGSKVGAMGLWQIMPATMRMFEGADAVNKRTDPALSTRAAMKILKSDYAKIQNWPLTLTAYNHGVNGMLRAIDETGSRDLCKVIDHYSSPSFRFASSNFYAQFLAARKVAMHKYTVLAKKGKGGSSLVLRRTVLSAKGGSLK
ncbi:lytic transglycosylase domain-containing protein [Silvanigrella aquatica]|uniref:Transglycosylase SLT domain-containing protein n=1 Tax=Silvanigrella aquatica TaxID=1915309 RepID=A0A1L4D1V6_9BACT|nr:lytic transglycosylase domain-containing protein [Silvanigrella aquatica]APJ04178.1 hypothetical protein AXG55_09785 [Silvanigrella aquatica]